MEICEKVELSDPTDVDIEDVMFHLRYLKGLRGKFENICRPNQKTV